MISVNLNQGVSPTGWTSVLCLAILAYLWFHSRLAQFKPATSSSMGHTLVDSIQSTRRVLSQVNPRKTETETDIDIIAIHGLDTKSPDTWTWKDPKDPENKDKWVNWLQHPDMLPSKVGCARIFTCDWPADLFERSDLKQKRFEEFARCLLDDIKRRPLAHRPILFIASCLGGVILMKALVMADDEYLSVRGATRGIIFLATPFRGTSFHNVATWAEPSLKAWAFIRGQKVTKLLSNVKQPTLALGELVRSFTRLCQDPAHQYYVFNFYELGKTNLLRRLFPWLPDWLGNPVRTMKHFPISFFSHILYI